VTLILQGQVAGHPLRILVPDGWSGRVMVAIDCHRGRPSRRVKVTREEAQDLTERDS